MAGPATPITLPSPSEPGPLAALLPKGDEPTLASDEILSRFIGYVSSTGISLYPSQEEAILELLGGKHLILNTPTGSGKSLVATALHFKAMAEGARSFYTCPIKALVNEKFFALCQAFGARAVGMLTGDASINRDAPIICCTAEILSNISLRESGPKVDYVVMDEFHYYGDKERGAAWEIPLLTLDRTTFLLMSATLGDMTSIEESLVKLTNRPVATVRSSQRPVPLDFEYRETPLHETIQDLISSRRAPVYLVNFTQRAAAEQAQNLLSVDFLTKEQKEAIRSELFDAKFDTPYGKEFQRFIRHGVGLHHAGLLPKYRLLVEKLSQAGHLKVVSGTDTLGVGVNIPIRTVLFTQLCKFDGEKTGILTARDFHQIAGRAGRKGFDDRGAVVAQAPEHVIENLRLSQKAATGKKVVKKQPPQRGYVHWDRNTFERLVSRAPEPLESRFSITHGMLLNLLQSKDDGGAIGYRRLVQIILRSHGNDYVRRKHLKTAAIYLRTLRQAGIVEISRRRGGDPPSVQVSEDLQHDFSLNHTLSLYLLETLHKLDSTAETYDLDIVTLVESILEDPDVILYAQLNKLKGEKVAELKAKGIEYEERMQELEQLEWPKPHRDFIYATFNDFAERHPWVGSENIRPKTIAREIFETFSSFHDYVRTYGLQRSEGVLLRYLGDVYKTLTQTVPDSFKTEQLQDQLEQLRLLLRGVDSSLFDEWERMQNPLGRLLPGEKIAAAQPKPIWEDAKSFAARIRGELHQLLKALAERRYPEAVELLKLGEIEWTPELLEKEMNAYWAVYPSVNLTPEARRPHNTLLKRLRPLRWEVRQRIMDPEDHGDWMLDCVVDSSTQSNVNGPFIELRRIGI